MYIKYYKIVFLHNFLDTITLISCSTLIFSRYMLVIAATTETQLYKDMTSSKISSLNGNKVQKRGVMNMYG